MPFRDAEPRSTFLLSGTFLLSCLSIAFFKLTSWFSSSGIFTTSSAQYGFDEVFVQIFAMVLLLAIERFCSYTSRQASAVLVVAASLQAVGSCVVLFPPDGHEQTAPVGGHPPCGGWRSSFEAWEAPFFCWLSEDCCARLSRSSRRW